jgi:phenylalanyl-tRNA synthetase beta chain
MMANSLTTALCQLSTMLEEHNVTMLNPLSNDLATIRQSLFSGLEAICNINRRNADLKFSNLVRRITNFFI